MSKKTKPVDPLVLEAKAMSDFELAKWAHSSMLGSFKQIAASEELERRKFWRHFFTHGIVSWIAIVISLISLVISILPNFFNY
jgi:hypothetical protein